MDFKIREVFDIVKGHVEQAASKPFKVSVMGTTGTGKSSLINALFGTDLKTDAVRPCTQEMHTVEVEGAKGSKLWFNDLPGIGEAGSVNETYIEQYREMLVESDVVIWAIHADSRSVAYDQQALDRILGEDPATRVSLMSKLTFVLTKADLLAPPPWIYAKDGDQGVFTPVPETQELLAEKEKYFQDSFVLPHVRDIVSRTHLERRFDVRDPALAADEFSVTYKGILTREKADELIAKHPKHADVFERLYDNYRVVSCSSLFRYNLGTVLSTVVNKLGPGAAVRFTRFVGGPEINRVAFEDARDLCNMIVFDQRRGTVVFDMADQGLWQGGEGR